MKVLLTISLFGVILSEILANRVNFKKTVTEFDVFDGIADSSIPGREIKIPVSNVEPTIQMLSIFNGDLELEPRQFIALKTDGLQKRTRFRMRIKSRMGRRLRMICPSSSLSANGCHRERLVAKGYGTMCKNEGFTDFRTNSHELILKYERKEMDIQSGETSGGFTCYVGETDREGTNYQFRQVQPAPAGGAEITDTECPDDYFEGNTAIVIYSDGLQTKRACKTTIESPENTHIVANCFYQLSSGECTMERIFIKGRFDGSVVTKQQYCGRDSFSETIKDNRVKHIHKRKNLSADKVSTGYICAFWAVPDSTDPTDPTDPTTPQSIDRQFCLNCGKSVVNVGVRRFNDEGNRIVGGQNATDKEYPWQATLYDTSSGQNIQSCGGSLIKPQWILTAAHCFRPGYLTLQTTVVGLGHLNIRDPNNMYHRIINIISHEHFNIETAENDIALLELQNPVMFTDSIRPICLGIDSDFSVGGKGIVTGHGLLFEAVGSVAVSPDILQEVELDMISNDQCADQYEAIGSVITDTMLCVETQDKGSCQGDSGGPFIVDIGQGQFAQSGIVSFANGCARDNYAAVYTKVEKFTDWIEEKTGGNNC